MKRDKSLVYNLFILAIGTVLPKTVTFITLPILTAYLTQAEYGTYDLINTLVSLCLPVITLQIQTAAFRFLIEHRDNEKEQRKIISTIMIFTVIMSVASLVIVFLVLGDVDDYLKILICFYFVIDILINTVRQIIRGLGKNKIYSASAVITSISNLLFIVIFVWLLRLGLSGLVLALSCSLLLSLIYIIVRINILYYIRIEDASKETLMKMLRYSWPMIPNSLAGWVMRLSDRLIIAMFLGIEANAVYAVACKFPTLYTVIQSTFTLAWQENASIVSLDEDSSEYYSQMFDVMYSVFYGIMALLIASSPVIFTILIQGDYDSAYYQMPFLYIAAFFSSMSAYLGGIYIANLKTKSVGISTGIGAAINLLVNFLLINKIGLYAASLSTLVSYMCLVVYRMVDIQKFQVISFKIKKCILLFLLLCVMGALSFLRNIWFDIINIFLAVISSYLLNRNIIDSAIKIVFQKLKKGK